MDKFEALIELIKGKKLTNAHWDGEVISIYNNEILKRSKEGTLTNFNPRFMLDSGWIDIDNMIEHLNDKELVAAKSLTERKKMYIKYIIQQLQKIETISEKSLEEVYENMGGDLEQFVKTVKNRLITLYTVVKEGTKEYGILSNLDTDIDIFRLKEAQKLNEEALKKYWVLNYYEKGEQTKVSGYGIEILEKLGIDLIPDTDSSFISYLNEKMHEKNKGHFQNSTNVEESLSEEEYAKKLSNYQKSNQKSHTKGRSK